VRLHSPTQNQIASGPQDDKKRAQGNEVDVEIRVLDIEFFENIVPFLENARTLAVLLTLKRLSVVAVDRLQHSLK